MADSMTTWQVRGIAHTKDGKYTSFQKRLKTAKPFFLDLNLPGPLTVGDRIHVPVVVHNNTDQKRSARVRFQNPEARWCTLRSDPKKTVTVNENATKRVYFPITAGRSGTHRVTVSVRSKDLKDAMSKEVTVKPDGRRMTSVYNGLRTRNTTSRTETFQVPERAIPGSGSMTVKIYPGILSQLREAAAGLLERPHGCFEQVTSSTYPNIMIARLLDTSDRQNPSLKKKSRKYICRGYQKLLSYEVDDGGFSLWGDSPADLFLTAYGLKEFTDMSLVQFVDRKLIQRTWNYLVENQHRDGFWGPDGEDRQERYRTTVFVTHALRTSTSSFDRKQHRFDDSTRTSSNASYRQQKRQARQSMQKALKWIENHTDLADSTYALAMTAYLFANARPNADRTKTLLNNLADRGKETAGGNLHWKPEGPTMSGTSSRYARIETTALALLAFQAAGKRPNLVSEGIQFLFKNRDRLGTWGTTYATVLTLKALVQQFGNKTTSSSGTIVARVNDTKKTVSISKNKFGTVQYISFPDALKKGKNTFSLETSSPMNFLFQASKKWWVPETKIDRKQPDDVSFDVQYILKEADIGQPLAMTARIKNETDRSISMPMVEINRPTGTRPTKDTLDRLRSTFDVDRVEVDPDKLILYLDPLRSNEKEQFRLLFLAEYPVEVKTRGSRAYPYYNPERTVRTEPVRISINASSPDTSDD